MFILQSIDFFGDLDTTALDGAYPSGYSVPLMELRKTTEFAAWLDKLDDIQARARIQVQIERLASGLTGDVKPVGTGVSELRINYGPGYRVYFKRKDREIVVLLAGGDKRTQSRDILRAQRLAKSL